MIQSIWNVLSREQRMRLLRDAMPWLEGVARELVMSDLARVLKSRASTITKRKNDLIAVDLARSLTLMKPAVQRHVLDAVFDSRGERALLFNQLVGLDADKAAPEKIEFSSTTLEPYRERFGEAEFMLALSFVAEEGHPACRGSAQTILDAESDRQREKRVSPSMQETAVLPTAASVTVELTTEVANQASPAADPLIEEWQHSNHHGRGDIAGSETEAGELSDAAAIPLEPPTVLSEDWSCVEMLDDELDRVVLRAIVASINGEEGALQPTQLRAFVVKLHKLNTAHFRSYFYIGFIDALQAQPAAQSSGGMNSPRRAWYLAGYHLGVRRMQADSVFLDGIEALNESDLEAFCDPLAKGAVQKLLSPVARAAIHESRVEILARWLRLCGPFDRGAVLESTRFALKERGSSAEQNAALLTACLTAIQHRRELESVALPQESELALILALIGCFRDLHGRKQFTDGLRQVRRLEWSGAGAEEIGVACAMHDLDVASPLRLVPASDEEMARSARVWTVFARKGIPGGACVVVEDISLLLRIIAEASEGALVLSKDEIVSAIERVQLLYGSITTSPAARFGTYSKGEFAKALEVLAALAVVVIPLEDRFAESAAVLHDWTAAGNRLAPSLLQVAFQSLLLLESPIVTDFFVECVQLYGPDFVKTDAVARIATHPGARAAREVLRGLLEDDRVSLPVRQRWEIAEMLGRAAASGGVDPQLAVVCIDHLERIVESHPKRFGQSLIDLLADPCWDNVLSEEHRASKQVDIALRTGDYARVGEQCSGMLQRALAESDVGMAVDALEALDRQGLGSWVSDEQREHLGALLAEESESADQAMPRARVLLVGGNEIQAVYDSRLHEWFKNNAPSIKLEFIHSGWKSNWTEYVAQVERRLEAGASSPDAIVVITMIRTILGQKVRALSGEHERPWVACTGRGFESLKRSALKAAQLGAAKRAGRTKGA